MWQPSKLTTQQKEDRRLAAVPLMQEGQMSQRQIARHLGVSRQTVNRWVRQLETGGREALRHRCPPGRKPHLDASQWQQVLEMLQQGAQSAGFVTERWTLRRIEQVIWQKFKVRYHVAYLSVRLRQLGWSPQKPAVYARERNEALVQAWLQSDWPRIQKKRAAWERP